MCITRDHVPYVRTRLLLRMTLKLFRIPSENDLKTVPNFFGGGKFLREQGTGNREQGTYRVPQVFPEHVPEPLLENPSILPLVFPPIYLKLFTHRE